MSLRQIIEPWNEQPSAGAQLRADGYALDALLPSNSGTVTRRLPFTMGANGTFVGTVNGRALRGSGSANVAALAANLTAFTEVTVTALIYVESWGGTYGMLWELSPDGQVNDGGFSLYNNGPTSGLTVATKGTSSATYNNIDPRPASGAWHIISSVHRIGAATVDLSAEMYANGVKLVAFGGSGGSPTSGGTFGNYSLNILSRDAASLPVTGNIPILYVHRTALSAGQIARLHRNIWSEFAPNTLLVPKASAAAFKPAWAANRNTFIGSGARAA